MGMVGIVGGMGPLAGIDLSKKIVNQTIAGKDQEHVAQMLFSTPAFIGDRTEYILGIIKENPAYAISDILLKLDGLGATVAGLPCNSAHAPEIFGVIQEQLQKENAQIELLHMIEEVGKFILAQFPEFKKVGILGTSGTYKTKQYNRIEKFGLEVINVSEAEVEEVHQSIYHPVYGIKSDPETISPESMDILKRAFHSLMDNGAQVIVLGCTELPLAYSDKYFEGIPLIDTTLVLARALINAVDSTKLKPW